MAHRNELLISAGSMAASITSPSIEVQYLSIGAIQCTFTGAPVGVMKLQASCDPVAPTPNSVPSATNWTDIDDTSVAVAAAGDIMYNISCFGYDQIRVVYTRTSGTGSLTVRSVAKG